jgi:NADPH:quinone reductase-like Zn-dependent oxidoreductase
MQAVQFDEYGDPSVLHLAEAPEPHAGPGQVRVAVRAVGVNPIDWKIRSGMMAAFNPQTFPITPGYEVAGVVDEVGDGVTGVAAGDEVFGSPVGGGAAQYAVLVAWARKPASLSWAQAGALTVAAETSGRAFALLGPLAGRTLLVHGAAGGVGSAGVQLAVARGATVIGTASEPNHDYLRSLGVTPTTYGDGLVERVAALAPDGVDLVFDTAGSQLDDLVAIAGGPDHVVTIAGGADAQRLGLHHTGGAGAERAWDTLDEVAGLIDAGRFSLPVQQTFPLAEAGEAQRISQDGHVRGKLVLLVD